jgi:hypothetical protein
MANVWLTPRACCKNFARHGQPGGTVDTGVIVSTVFKTYVTGVTPQARPTPIASNATISGTSAGSKGVSGPTGTARTLTNHEHSH